MKLVFKITVLTIILLSLSSFVIPNYVFAEEFEGLDIENRVEGALDEADELIEKYSPQNLLLSLKNALHNAFFGYLKAFASLIFLTLLIGVINAVTSNRTATYAGEILILFGVFRIVTSVCESVSVFAQNLENFILSLLPVMTTLYTASGAPITAASSYGTTLLVLNVSAVAFASILIPTVKLLAVFSSVTLISRSFDFSGLVKFIRSTVSWIFGCVSCIMSAGIFFQQVLSVSKDGIVSRTVRYAASSVIPVIGSVVSESARTLSESMKLIRGVSGAAGVLAVIGLLTAPIAAIAVCRFFMQICSVAARLTGCIKICNFYDELCGILGLFLGACIGVSIIFILILGIFARTAISV